MIDSQGRARLTMFLALLALVGIAVKFLNIAALHFLRPDANPVSEPISNYGVVPMVFSSLSLTLGAACRPRSSSWALFRFRASWSVLCGAFSLGLFGVSELLGGIFPIDVGGEATTAGTIHNIIGNIAFFCFPIAAILLSLRMGKDERWRSFRRPALALAIVVVLTVILTIAGSSFGIGFGVIQRVANVAVLVWMFVVALHLRSVAHGALAQQASRAS